MDMSLYTLCLLIFEFKYIINNNNRCYLLEKLHFLCKKLSQNLENLKNKIKLHDYMTSFTLLSWFYLLILLV